MSSSTSTFVEEDDDDEEEDWSVDEEPQQLSMPQPQQQLSMPTDTAGPAAWLDYYQQRLTRATEWTEQANLYYAMGNTHVQLQQYEAATRMFEAEAALLTRRGAPPAAILPIYKSLAKLWTVRCPNRALTYYTTALEYCTANGQDAQHIRHAMGRLYFSTGNLERAMQVSLGITVPTTTTTLPK